MVAILHGKKGGGGGFTPSTAVKDTKLS